MSGQLLIETNLAVFLLQHSVFLHKNSLDHSNHERKNCLCSHGSTLVIYCTLGNFSKPVGTIILPKLPTFLGYFCKRVQKLSFLMKYFWGTFIDIIV